MIVFLLENIRKQKRDSFLSMFFVAFESFIEILIPFVMARLIDEGIEAGDFESIQKYSAIIFIFVILQATSGMLCAIFAVKASNNMAYNLRSQVFNHIQEFSFANIDKFSTGSLVSRCTTDITNVKQAFQMTVRGACRGVLMMIFCTFMTFKVYAPLARILLIFIPVVIIAFLGLARFAMPVFQKLFRSIDDLNNQLSENIHGVRVVKSFNREEDQIFKFKTQTKRIYDLNVKAEKFIAMWGPIMNLAMYTLIILISYFGARAIVDSGNDAMAGLTTGGIMSLITYSMQLLMSLMMISFIFVMIIISRESVDRIYQVVREKSDIVDKDNPIGEVKSGDIRFDRVYYRYNNMDHFAIEDVDISIKEGESIGIIGATGSGKTTFVNMIPRLYDTTKGSVRIGNIDVKDYSLYALRSAIGMVMQKNVLFSGTIASNLRFAKEDATDEEINKVLKEAFASEFVDLLPDGIYSKVEQGGTNFSGGQKQRLCIARALLKNPKILIFDDSTSALDTKTDKTIRDTLNKNYKNVTKITIAQKVLSVMELDRIMVFDDGKVIAFDTHDKLLESCPIYRELYELQQKG